jgi:hypothetical protein
VTRKAAEEFGERKGVGRQELECGGHRKEEKQMKKKHNFASFFIDKMRPGWDPLQKAAGQT